MLSKFNCNTLVGWKTVHFHIHKMYYYSVNHCIEQSISIGFNMFLYRMHGSISYLIVLIRWEPGSMIKYRVIDLLFKCPCQVYCGVCNVSHDRQTLSISASVTLRYICESWWSNGLGVCLARRRSWVQFPRWHIPPIFSVGVFAERESIYVV